MSSGWTRTGFPGKYSMANYIKADVPLVAKRKDTKINAKTFLNSAKYNLQHWRPLPMIDPVGVKLCLKEPS